MGQRGGGVRELSTLLRAARQEKVEREKQLSSRDGVAVRANDLLSRATKRAQGEKIKDDPVRLAKALAKRKSKKRQSAKKWASRIEALHKSVENVVADRQKNKYKGKRKDKKAADGKKGGKFDSKKKGSIGGNNKGKGRGGLASKKSSGAAGGKKQKR